MLTTLLNHFRNKKNLKMKTSAWEKGWILYHKTNKEALTVLCSVVKHLGSGDTIHEVGRNSRLCLVFPPTLPAWKTDHSRGFCIC